MESIIIRLEKMASESFHTMSLIEQLNDYIIVCKTLNKVYLTLSFTERTKTLT